MGTIPLTSHLMNHTWKSLIPWFKGLLFGKIKAGKTGGNSSNFSGIQVDFPFQFSDLTRQLSQLQALECLKAALFKCARKDGFLHRFWWVTIPPGLILAALVGCKTEPPPWDQNDQISILLSEMAIFGFRAVFQWNPFFVSSIISIPFPFIQSTCLCTLNSQLIGRWHQETREFHSVSLWRQLADASVAAGDWEMATQAGEKGSHKDAKQLFPRALMIFSAYFIIQFSGFQLVFMFVAVTLGPSRWHYTVIDGV